MSATGLLPTFRGLGLLPELIVPKLNHHDESPFLSNVPTFKGPPKFEDVG
jgi:hypothetical protein